MEEIAGIASGIEYADAAEESDDMIHVFEMLSELRDGEHLILKAAGKLFRSFVDARRMSLSADEFKTTYSSDSGSTNPILFERGLFLDICHAAMAATPTDLNLHRKRTIVCTGFNPAGKAKLPGTEDWKLFDDGYGRSKMIQIDPSLLKIRAGRMVHDYSIYSSESEHILWTQADMDTNGFFIMDGPLYPRQLMYWMGTDSEKVLIRYDKNAKQILQNYIDIMDFHLKNKMPVVGFVKNPAETQIMNLLRKRVKEEKKFMELPWATDTQMFKALLKPAKADTGKADTGKAGAAGASAVGAAGAGTENAGARFKITYTNWFLQLKQYYDDDIKTGSPLMEESLTHSFEPEDYTVAFFAVRVPYEDSSVVFKIESLYGLIKDEDMRRRITQKILYELSAGKIPETLLKADSIAKIGGDEKKEIQNLFTVDKSYNNFRWGDFDEL